MRKLIIFCFGILCAYASVGQNPDEIIKVRRPKKKVLEHFIKVKIDSIREKSKLHPLANDSTLYLAAKDHADYLVKFNKLSHVQMVEEKKTEMVRVEYYGGNNYSVYELLGDAYMHRPIKPAPSAGKKKKKGGQVTLTTYRAIADYYIQTWTANTTMRNQIMNDRFLTIGVGVEVNKTNDNIKAVAVLGRPYLKFVFKENKKMFPYSKFEMYQVTKSFKEAKNVTAEKTLPGKLKNATSPSHCSSCSELINKIRFEVVEEKSNIVLKSRDVESLKELFSGGKNGLMLEVVRYETYHQGNPDYYELASRRNGKSLFTGKTSTPRFGEYLSNGFNKKKNTWRVVLGKVPKENGYYEKNVWVICNKKLCSILHFDEYCGDANALFEPLVLKNDLRHEPYQFVPKRDSISFAFSFGDKSYNIPVAKLKSMEHAALTHPEFENSMVILDAYAPILDYKHTDPKLFRNEAKTLKDSISKYLGPKIKVILRKTRDTLAFNKMLRKTPDSVYIGAPSKILRNAFGTKEKKRTYEDQLLTHWRAEAQMIFYHDTLAELFSEYAKALEHLSIEGEKVDTAEVHRTEVLQAHLIDFADMKNINPRALIKIPHIAHKPELVHLMNNQAWYEYTHIWMIDHDPAVLKDFYDKIKYDATEVENPDPIHVYNHLAFSVNHWGKKTFDPEFKWKKIKAELKKLRESKIFDDMTEIDRAFDIKAAYYFSQFHDNEKASKLCEKTLNEIEVLYKSHDDPDVAINLAYTLTHYHRYDKAIALLKPYASEDNFHLNAFKLYLKLTFQHVPKNPKEVDDVYYTNLITADQKMSTDEWCSLFVGPCNISFQAFDYEELRRVWCEKCGKFVNYAMEEE